MLFAASRRPQLHAQDRPGYQQAIMLLLLHSRTSGDPRSMLNMLVALSL